MKKFISGTYINQGYYSSFQPTPIMRQWYLEDMEIQYLLSDAYLQLGRLDMYSEYIPNIDLFINMHVAKEATQSSKIEGTQTSIEDSFLLREEVEYEKRNDWNEVNNYISAMHFAIEQIKTLPFSSRLIRNIHQILLESVRGEHKLPGDFRTSQNWIGGATINDAVFIPPVHTSIHELMTDIEKFAHDETKFFPDLLKIALIHYQFETIHPFLDGNGRTGRLLIPLYLVDKGILKMPILFLSDFFERNRMLYYDNLSRARTNNDIKQWFKFFLVGITQTAKNGIASFDSTLKLKKEKEEYIQKNSKRPMHLLKVLDQLFQKPIINVQRIQEITSVSLPTSYKIIDELVGYGILKEMTGGRRGQRYVFEAYMSIF
ncbi:Fic family protein [Sphingobacterium hungaricum]|uniref:Cell filamentation protein Fic n=1 Tax=Sphingobacterium hungaricum TaxID=2082723 RepID=A0A928UWX5_9SPHI|nr:Fic family protein [Sphingobacterium hungaricum]MBE8713478.1 cell filamentation protein Fic [Sphingobacterium hungaricum]